SRVPRAGTVTRSRIGLLLRTASARQDLGAADQHARVDTQPIADKAEHDDGADPEAASAPGDAKAATPILAPPVFNVVAARQLIETHFPLSYTPASAAQSWATAFSPPEESLDEGRHPHRSAIRNRSARLLAGHHTLYQPGDDGEDRASGAAADDLTHDGPEIEVAAGRRVFDRRNEGLQNLTSANAANGACDGVTEIAQIVVLQGGAGGVPAADTRDELNDQIDDRFHGASLSLAARCCRPRLPISPHACPVCRVLRASSACVLSA